jgi:ribose transport system substrate-binding protein
MLTKRTRGALLLAAAAAVALSCVAASANAGVAATAPTKAQCVKQARAATSAVKKRFTIPSYPSFRMKASAGKNVWYIAPSLGTGYALALSQGVKAAAETAGLDLTVWDSRGLTSEMGAGLDRAIADKADMIVIHSINPTVVTNQLKEAAAAKIPVLSILNALDPKALPTGITATLDPDAPKLGALLMDFALSTSKCQLNTGWFYAPSFPIMQQMTKGVMAERARLCPSCPIKNVAVDLTTMASQLSGATANFLLSNPKVNYVIAAFDTAATFMIQGIRTSGSKVQVIGANGNPPNLDILRSGGPQVADIAYPPAEFLGWDVVDQVGRILQGQKTALHRPIAVQTIDYTNVGKDNSLASVFPKVVGYDSAYKKMWGM